LESITLTEFKNLGSQRIIEKLPFIVTADYKQIAVVFGDMDDVLVIKGMHPAAKRKLTAAYKLMRTAQGETKYD